MHKILLRKLANHGVELKALKWFESHLSDRQLKCLEMVNCPVPVLLPVVFHGEALMIPPILDLY